VQTNIKITRIGNLQDPIASKTASHRRPQDRIARMKKKKFSFAQSAFLPSAFAFFNPVAKKQTILN
jgi:hypothetical protein